MSDDYTPTVEAFRGVYGQMFSEWRRGDALAEFDRFIARIKADALREALLSDETVERAARALLAYEEGANGVTWEVLGEYERDVHLNAARVVLTAAIGGGDV